MQMFENLPQISELRPIVNFVRPKKPDPELLLSTQPKILHKFLYN